MSQVLKSPQLAFPPLTFLIVVKDTQLLSLILQFLQLHRAQLFLAELCRHLTLGIFQVKRSLGSIAYETHLSLTSRCGFQDGVRVGGSLSIWM